MPAFALESFEAQAEGFLRARNWRELQFLNGMRPGRGLVRLYEEHFPSFTSTDLWADLQAATFEDERQHLRLSALLASAYLEGRTREFAVQATRVQASTSLSFEDTDVPWRLAPARWQSIDETPRRHALEESWRSVFRAELNPILERWHEALRLQLRGLSGDEWVGFWSNLRGVGSEDGVARLAQSILERTDETYRNALGVYLGQLALPIDDVWTSDAEWAFRASRFDSVFSRESRNPTLVRVFRDLGIELEEQTNVRQVPGEEAWLRLLAVDIPNELYVVWHPVGGWADYAQTFRGLAMAEHLAHTDASLPMWERWLGDDTPTLGYGYLLESLLLDRTWLTLRMEYPAGDDFRIIGSVAWLYRLRRAAAAALYEQRWWQAEPGASMAADFEEAMSTATRVRHFPDSYAGLLLGAPWSTLRNAIHLRAEVFAAQLRAYLRAEFDEEWWRSSRAARFIKDELWRPGKRHSAEELLGFMGYEGFDPEIPVAEIQEVLLPL